MNRSEADALGQCSMRQGTDFAFVVVKFNRTKDAVAHHLGFGGHGPDAGSTKGAQVMNGKYSGGGHPFFVVAQAQQAKGKIAEGGNDGAVHGIAANTTLVFGFDFWEFYHGVAGIGQDDAGAEGTYLHRLVEEIFHFLPFTRNGKLAEFVELIEAHV